MTAVCGLKCTLPQRRNWLAAATIKELLIAPAARWWQAFEGSD